ncbi:hypothetical protein CPB83DRAFT_732895, partial [Crepidotus variabilis]
MTWINAILEQYTAIDSQSLDEREYYGPYNTLLAHLFPYDDYFQVVPIYRGPISPGSIELSTMYIVQKRGCPVFFLEIKPGAHLENAYARWKADEQMREGFRGLIDQLKDFVQRLYGVSVIGTRFSVYSYEKASTMLSPYSIPQNPTILNDRAPVNRWRYDLLEESGEAKIKEVVAEAK